MAVDFRGLNKVIPAIHVAVPTIITFLDKLSRELETYHGVLGLANAFFSISIAEES